MARASSVLSALGALALAASLLSCTGKADPNTLVMVIESSPTNLDPRVGIDAYSERIDNLIFDDLLSRGDNLDVAPGLAERWEIPNPLTYVFHLHDGVKFHDGRPLTSRDVKWTFDSLMAGKVRSTKAAAYRFVDHLDAPDDFTVVFHMKEPDAALLWNMSDGAVGIVPYGSGAEVSRNPIGSGPFKFVSAETDKEVIIERNEDYWGEKAKLPRVRFAVVPDATTRALELRKGSADLAINALTPDTVLALAARALSCRRTRSRHRSAVPRIQSSRSDSERCARTSSDRLCARPPADDRIFVAGHGAAGAQRSSTAKLGLQRRRADLRSRSRQSGGATRRSRLSRRKRRAFSHHHEDFHRRKHASHGCGYAAATPRRWELRSTFAASSRPPSLPM